MLVKKWVTKKYDKDEAYNLCRQNGYSGALSVLLAGRGIIDPQQADAFINCEDAYCDPFSFADMDEAVQRIEKAIDNFEKIAVYGDYDADGVTATALLYSYLVSHESDVIYYIPQRDGEGYGLHNNAADTLKSYGVSLIITVDNGISAIDEVDYINSIGMDIIITDHHTPGDILPKAIAVVNPHRVDCYSEFKEYAGAGVAFKLIQALEGGAPDSLLNEYADLAALGTIGDVVPLVGENRAIVKHGLKLLKNNKRIGLNSLIDAAGMTGRSLTCQNAAYCIVPRINAAGRMGTPDRAVKLLLTENEEEAVSISGEIEDNNRERQQIELDIFNQAKMQIDENPDILFDRILVLSGEGWHKGVIGIVASRICERYGKPCVMISIDGNYAKGSGRSIEGFSLYDAVKSCEKLLTRYGGHTLAAGMEMEASNIDEFRKSINRYAGSLECPMPVPQMKLDFKLRPSAATLEITSDIHLLEPFGRDNPLPVFGLYSMEIESVYPLAGGKHLKLALRRDGAKLYAVKFTCTPDQFPFKVGDIVDLAVTLDRNEYNNEVSLSIIINEIRLSGFNEEEYFRGLRLYEALKRRDDICRENLDDILPSRDDIAIVYRFIKASNGWNWGINILFSRLDDKVNMCKMLISLDVLSEMGIIEYNFTTDENTNIKLCNLGTKINLEDSRILNNLKSGKKVW